MCLTRLLHIQSYHTVVLMHAVKHFDSIICYCPVPLFPSLINTYVSLTHIDSSQCMMQMLTPRPRLNGPRIRYAIDWVFQISMGCNLNFLFAELPVY